MKRYSFSLVFLLLLITSACQQASVSPQPVYQTEVQLQASFVIPEILRDQAPSNEMGYLLYLPKGYGEEPDKRWPVIFFLHGAGGGDNASQFVMTYGLPEVLFAGDQPKEFPFIVVSPQAFPDTSWWMGNTLDILSALVDEVSNLYKVDKTRIYLTGLSMGGYGSWHLVSAYPDRFAAVVSVSGSGFGNVVPEIEVLCALADTPLWAIHGAMDLISDPLASKMFTVSLDSDCPSKEVKWTLYPDTGHGETYERAYRDPTLYAWLLEHTRVTE